MNVVEGYGAVSHVKSGTLVAGDAEALGAVVDPGDDVGDAPLPGFAVAVGIGDAPGPRVGCDVAPDAV